MAQAPTLGDGVATIQIGDALVEMWRDPASAARWRWVMAQREALIALHPKGIVDLSVILSTSTPPDGALRSTMQGDFRRLGSSLRLIVVVPIGDSLWLSVVRTIVRGILMVSGLSKQQAVAGSIDAGIDRLLEAAGPDTPSRAELRAAVAALTKALGVAEPATASPP